MRDQNGLVVDEEGLALADADAIEREALQTMADAARDSLYAPLQPGEIAIEVRDDIGLVMKLSFTFEMRRISTQQKRIGPPSDAIRQTPRRA